MGFGSAKVNTYAIRMNAIIFLMYLLSSLALAASPANKLIYIKKLDLDISYNAEPDKWCAPQVNLNLITSKQDLYKNSTFLETQMVKLIKRLRQKCEPMKNVRINGFLRNDAEKIIIAGNYAVENEWRFTSQKVNVSGNKPKTLLPLAKSDYIDLRKYDQTPLQRMLAFRVIHHNPELIEDDKIILKWLTAEAHDKKSPIQAQAKRVYNEYQKGTDFDKQDIIVRYRKYLKQKLKDMAEDLEKPLALNAGLWMRPTGKFKKGKGFPQRVISGSNNGISLKSKPEFGLYLSISINYIGKYLDMPLRKKVNLGFLPITENKKARVVAKLIQDQRRYKYDLRFYVQLSKIKKSPKHDRALIGAMTWDRAELELNDLETKSRKLLYKYKLKELKSDVGFTQVSELATVNKMAIGKIDTSKYKTPADIGFSRLIGMRAVYEGHVKLSDDFVLKWMKTDAAAKGKPYQKVASEHLTAYNKGTSFEKTDVLAKFKKRLIKEIRTRGDTLTQDIFIKYETDADIRDHYTAGKGFTQSGHKYDREVALGTKYLDARIYVLRGMDFSVLNYVPILKIENARKFAKILKKRKRYEFTRRYYYRLKKMHWNEDSSINKVSFDVEVDQVSLRMSDTANPDQPSRLVYAWDNLKELTEKVEKVAAGDLKLKATNRMSPLEFAKQTKMKVLRGHVELDLGGNEKNADKKKQTLINFYYLSSDQTAAPFVENKKPKGWKHLQNLLELRRTADFLQNPGIRNAAIKLYGSSRQKASLGKQGVPLLNGGLRKAADEFELNEHIEKLKQIDIEARLDRLMPQFPFPAIRRATVELGEYDFERKSFPIIWNRKPLSSYKPTMQGLATDDYLLTKYPDELKLSSENAKKLLGFMKKQQNRNLYLAVFLDIHEKILTSEDVKSTSRYIAVPKTMALYLDEGLTKKVREFDVRIYSKTLGGKYGVKLLSEKTPEISPERETDESNTQRSISDILKKDLINTLGLALTADRMLPDHEYLEGYHTKSKKYENAHELESDDILRKLVEDTRSLDLDTKEFWMFGWAVFGKYDLNRKGFNIDVLDLQAVGTPTDSYYVRFNNEVDNAKDFEFAYVNKAEARKLLDSLSKYNKRQFTIRALVEPKKVSSEYDGDYLQTSIRYKLKELYIIFGNEDENPSKRYIISAIKPEGSTSQDNTDVASGEENDEIIPTVE